MLKHLILNSKINPFLSWPNVDPNQTVNFLYSQAKIGEEKNETFCIVRNGIIILYFQFQKLKWDTNHFKFRCEKICNLFISTELNVRELNSTVKEIKTKIDNYLALNQITFVFADIPSSNSIANLFIQKMGFKFVINWLDGFVLSENVTSFKENYEFGSILPNEVEHLVKISTKDYYKGGRFYHDKKFERNLVEQLYGSLIKTSFQNKEVILVCRKNGFPIGAFISNSVKSYPLLSGLKVAGLRFLIVDSQYRGMNIGSELFSAILNLFKGEADIIKTGFETHNLISLNLHIKKGFRFNYSHNAYHLWT